MVSIPMLIAALLLLLPLVTGVSLGQLDSDTTSAAQQAGGGDHHPQRRAATEEWDERRHCQEEQCVEATCSECGPDDWKCTLMCRMNCECGCGGHPRGGMDRDVWKACHRELECSEKFDVCRYRDSCVGNQECEARCELDYSKCNCECVHTSTQRMHNWETCIVQSQCTNATCSECDPDDEGCADMCRMNCQCGCGGHPRGGMDYYMWDKCNRERKCWSHFEKCWKSCGENKECVARCELDHNKCYCGCVQTALTTTQRKQPWDTCIVQSQCTNATCSECAPDDKNCADMCRMNCECGCGGYAPGGMDHDAWEACSEDRECTTELELCRRGWGCEGLLCEAMCELEYYKCNCECVAALPLTATQRKHNWDTCLVQRQCHNKTCSECRGADALCAKRCARRCECGCAHHPWRDLLSGEWEECFVGTRSCEEAHSACVNECLFQECRLECDLDLIECRCECHSATEEEWRLWYECRRNHECGDKTCSECGKYDTECADRCRHNCECRCLGIPADSLDDLPLQECKIKSGCQSEYKKCQEKCNAAQDKECEHSCLLASEKCHCKCAQTSSVTETESRESERVEIIQHCNYIC